jgi:cyclophilin family peptidyl-prolyl cis-trans isomerase
MDPVLGSCDKYIAGQGIDKSGKDWRTRLPEPPELAFDSGKKYYWDLETSQGAIRVRLLPKVAPKHVASTIYLTRLGFYDDLTFHRVIPGFMAQGGCPLGTGTGGPGYQYAGECDPKVKHDRPGLLSMANAGPGTDGSQFFLTFVATPWLDGKHTVFGEVVEGADALRELELRGTEGGRTTEPLLLRSAAVTVE